MKLVIKVLPTLVLLVFGSCKWVGVDKKNSAVKILPGDLTILKGSQVLGIGKLVSGTANQSFNCTADPVVLFLPKKMQSWIVAYGGATYTETCGACTYQFHCTPGESLHIETSIAVYGDDPQDSATPVVFETNYPGPAFFDYMDVCPVEGKFNYLGPNTIDTISSKIKITSSSGTDTEYIRCDI